MGNAGRPPVVTLGLAVPVHQHRPVGLTQLVGAEQCGKLLYTSEAGGSALDIVHGRRCAASVFRGLRECQPGLLAQARELLTQHDPEERLADVRCHLVTPVRFAVASCRFVSGIPRYDSKVPRYSSNTPRFAASWPRFASVIYHFAFKAQSSVNAD